MVFLILLWKATENIRAWPSTKEADVDVLVYASNFVAYKQVINSLFLRALNVH